MKKIRIIVTVIIVMLLTACSTNQTVQNDMQSTESASEFALIEIPVQTKEFSGKHYYFYRDPVTDVVFMVFEGKGNGFTWLPDPDTGAPLKYNQFVELYAEYIPTEELQGEITNE